MNRYTMHMAGLVNRQCIAFTYLLTFWLGPTHLQS